MASNVQREEGSGKAREADDCLTAETKRVWSYLKDPNISTISIWGWDGIGKSIILNKIMEEAKEKLGEECFDVVIAVSVPEPLSDRPSHDAPSVQIQRLLGWLFPTDTREDELQKYQEEKEQWEEEERRLRNELDRERREAREEERKWVERLASLVVVLLTERKRASDDARKSSERIEMIIVSWKGRSKGQQKRQRS